MQKLNVLLQLILLFRIQVVYKSQRPFTTTNVSEAQVSSCGRCNTCETVLCVHRPHQQKVQRAGLGLLHIHFSLLEQRWSPLWPKEATAGLTHDLTGSKDLGTGSGTLVFGGQL